MTNLQVQQMLAEMRSLATQATGNQAQKPNAAGQGEGADFSNVLKSALNTVNEYQQAAGAKQEAFIRGEDISLSEVMIASQKSKVAFEATKQVRNRLLEAYQEISRMQI